MSGGVYPSNVSLERDLCTLAERVADLRCLITSLSREVNALKSTDARARETSASGSRLSGTWRISNSAAAQNPVPSDDLILFLRSVDGCVDCDPDGTVRLIFCEETRVPLAVIEEAVKLALDGAPAGRVSVVADGGIAVELRPAVAAEEVGE